LGDFFSLGSFYEKYPTSPSLCAAYFQGKSYVLLLTKIGWATFWAIFEQTHLVTLNTKQHFGMSIKFRHVHEFRKNFRKRKKKRGKILTQSCRVNFYFYSK
jgi:hypothetical protein